MSDLFSLQTEKYCLAGLLRNPEVYYDLSTMVSDKDFADPSHNIIFSAIAGSILKNETVNPTFIAKKIKDAGITFKDGLDIFDYIDSIQFIKTDPKSLKEAFRTLVDLRVRREIAKNATEIVDYLKKSKSEPIDKVISHCDVIYNKEIQKLFEVNEPVNLFDGLPELIEEKGNKPVENLGFKTGFDRFDERIGGLRNGNLYAIVSRSGEGKSSFLNSVALGVAIKSNFKIKVLYLDTEMYSEDMKLRTAASLTNVPLWYLETGNWRRNEEMVKRVRGVLPAIKNYQLFHYEVGNKNIDDISSFVRRWFYKHVGRGGQCLVLYDYVKLTGEKMGANYSEHQIIGEKIDKIKKLAEEINCPIFVAAQMNRSGNNFNKKSSELVDDSTAVALSDRLLWFTSYLGIFRRKTPDEIAEDGEQFGQHKLISLKERFQGKNAAGHLDLVHRIFRDGTERAVINYLSFKVENFKVEEVADLHDIIEANQEQHVLANDNQQQNNDEVDI